jgi:hypothetical protein
MEFLVRRTYLSCKGHSLQLEDRIVDIPLLTGSATRSCCTSQDRIAEGLPLGVHLRSGPKAWDPLYKRG